MRIAIDASNIRTGGGLNHLFQILKNFDSKILKVEKIYIWASINTIKQLPLKKEIVYIDVTKYVDSTLGYMFWQVFMFKSEIKKTNCDILFVPGGLYLGLFRPYYAMAQNLLPFDKKERSRYKFSLTYFRYLILNKLQKYTFYKAEGTIFLTRFSMKIIKNNQYSKENKKDVVIYHGVDEGFFNYDRKYVNLKSSNRTINLLYVSIINYYKNHLNVLEALDQLIDNGYKINLNLVGPIYKPAYNAVKKKIEYSSNLKNNVIIYNEVEYIELKNFYNNADIFVFASSCETFGMIVLEAMAAGLPIACSEMSSMKEIIDNNCEYFNPKDSISIFKAIEVLIHDFDRCKLLGQSARESAKRYTWEKCTNQTFNYLTKSKNKQ